MPAVERQGIGHIADDQRHGRPINQFTIRFAPVIYLAAVFVGATGIPMGLGLAGSLIAILLGNVLGSVCTAVCAVMGPRLGMPQLAMGRSSFGYHGNYLPAFLALLLFIGYFTVGTVLGAKSLADLFGVSYPPMAITVGIVSILIAVFGYNLLHSFGKWVTRISIVILFVVSVYALVYGAGDAAATTLAGGEYWLAWLLQFTVVFSYTMSWAPYASDYSRYLPVRTSTSKIFGWAFAGLFLSTTWMMALGGFLATLNADGGVLGALGIVLPAVLLKIVLIGLGIAAIPHNAVNLYSGAMASLTYDLPIRRATVVTLAGILGCVLALVFGGDDFQHNFEAFLFLVSYFVMPWLAILCADYFRTHSAGTNYPEVQTFYDNRGAFGGINWPGFGGFITGIAVAIPFMATDLYHGPIGDALGGADVSYFVSFLVAAGVYLTLRRSAPHLAAHR